MSSTLYYRVWEGESEYLLVGVFGRTQRGGLTDTTAEGAAKRITVSDPATIRHQVLLEKQIRNRVFIRQKIHTIS